MTPEHAIELVHKDKLYPGVILHGGEEPGRRSLALHLARALLCEAAREERPCDGCRHCRRVQLPGGDEERFHPDVVWVERDLRTSTSVEAVKAMLRTAQVAPFEARGQVFVICSADSMTPAAANALLKTLEEPALTTPRHFLLLTPAPSELLPTLRSRCLSIYLGPSVVVALEDQDQLVDELGAAVESWRRERSGVYLLAIADLLAKSFDWSDPRSGAPLVGVATLLTEVSKRSTSPALRRSLLAAAAVVLEAKELRMRAISPTRILEASLAEALS